MEAQDIDAINFDAAGSMPSTSEEDSSGSDALGADRPVRQIAGFSQKTWRFICLLSCVLLLVATLVPLLMLAPYVRPSADDYSYGLEVHRAVLAHGGPLEILSAAFNTVVFYWWRWQGSFSGMFFMALQPGCFSTEAYVLVPFITLGFLCLGIFVLSYTLMVKWLKLSRSLWFSVASLVSALAILQQPSARESFLWYNGGMYYSSFFGLMLIYVALLFRITYQGVKHPVLGSILLSFLSLILSGGNYVALVLTWEITAILSVICFLKNDSRPNLKYCVLPMLILIVGSLINCLAPGNSGRADMLHGMSAPKTIIYSITKGLNSFSDCANGIVVLGLIVIVLLSVNELGQTQVSFSRPWLATFWSYELFCSCYTPTFFAMGDPGPARVRGFRYDLAILLLAINVIWWAGYIVHKRQEASRDAYSFGFAQGPATLLVGVLMVLSIGGTAFDSMRITSYTAFRALRDGSAAGYARQVDERESLLRGHEGEDVQVPPITVKPPILYNQDLSSSSNGWENGLVADWYSLNSVVQVDPDK